MVKPGHPAYEAEKERLKDTIALNGEDNVKIQVRGEEIVMLEVHYAGEGIEKREYKIFEKEKNIWHTYSENPFFKTDTSELYTGHDSADMVLLTFDIFTFFIRGLPTESDFTENKKKLGEYIASATFYNEKSPLFRKFFHFLQTHEDTETNRLDFFRSIAEEYNLEKDIEKALKNFDRDYQKWVGIREVLKL